MTTLAETLQARNWWVRSPAWDKATPAELPDLVLDAGLASSEELLAVLGEFYGVPSLTAAELDCSPAVRPLMSQELCEYWSLLPLQMREGLIVVAMADPWDFDAANYLTMRADRGPDIQVCLRSDLQEACSRAYSGSEMDEETLSRIQEGANAHVQSAEKEFQDAPVIRLVQHIIEQGVNLGASDIHLEPGPEGGSLRYRLDGALQKSAHPAPLLHTGAVARLKVMANLNVSETRFPQDGRIGVQVGKRKIDLRVSTLPFADGEGVVLRILDKSGVPLDLKSLGFPSAEYDLYTEAIRAPHGLVLVAGPTGSGKTTTLYATLSMMSTPDRKVISVEDPVEYRLAGIQQSPVREEIGYTFEMGLRAILRHDPDVVMIGEIRDHTSAEIAVRSALTGHMVLSTIHTNDAVQAVTRLIDMGIPEYLVTAVLRMVVSQRLVRRLCPLCKVATRVAADELRRLGLSAEGDETVEICGAVGCSSCHSGFKGRFGIYEILDALRLFREGKLMGASASGLADFAVANLGMRTLRAAGLEQVVLQQTTLDEVLRVTAGSPA